jgi:hypothetical protein
MDLVNVMKCAPGRKLRRGVVVSGPGGRSACGRLRAFSNQETDMGCRCGERRAALRRAARAVVRGDRKAAGSSLAFVGRSMVQDAQTIATGAAGRRLAARAGVGAKGGKR